MTELASSPEAIAPLLAELAGLRRALDFYPADHPAVRDALDRAFSLWRRRLARLGEVKIELRGGLFALPDGTPVRAEGIDALAQELGVRRVRALRVTEGLEASELVALVKALRAPEDDSDGVADALLRAQVRHIEASMDPGVRPDRPRAPAAALELDDERGNTVVDLVRKLAELERCDQIASYKGLVLQVVGAAEGLIRRKHFPEAYKAILALCRHAGDQERVGAIRAEAAERLQQLLRFEEAIDYLVEQACADAGLASVQAIQVLSSIGPSVVPRMISDRSSRDSRKTDGVLIAMGDAALPAIVDELGSEQPARVRRAARLLGEMQNPRGVGFLIERLDHPDPLVRKEVGKALAWVGTPAAIETLVGALERQPEIACIAAASLGDAGGEVAVDALARVVLPEGGRDEMLRREAIRSLGRIGHPAALPVLRRVLTERPWLRAARVRTLRIAAAHAIGRIGGAEAFAILEEQGRDSDLPVRQACREATRWMGGSRRR